jgi:hypothetical protein
MSRSFDVLLVALVGGLGWWLFDRDGRPLKQVGDAPPTRAVELPAPPPPASPAGGEPVPAPPQQAPVTVTWAVDDPALLAHPSFQLVVVEATTGRLVPLAWDRAPDGRVSCTFAAGQRAVGLALVHPALEVLAWIPLDATSGLPEELPVRLAERFARIAFDVRDADGQVVHDARLSACGAAAARTLDGAPAALPSDADGKVLVPRRAGVCIDVWSARGTATVDEPVDGRTVQLTAR